MAQSVITRHLGSSTRMGSSIDKVKRPRDEAPLRRVSTCALRRWLLACAVFVFLELVPGLAHAYPWMIRHDYTACAQCHVDPSGGGPLTQYGRAMGEVVLRTQYSEAAGDDDAAEPGPGAKFLWGALPLPEWLDLGGSLRTMAMTQHIGDAGISTRVIFMQQDLNATVQVGRFVASGSVGYAPKGAQLAAITNGPEENLVSRFHWIGYRLDEDATMLVRAGRMNLPFGVRDIQHTLTVRTATRTDINDNQQHGISFSYSGEHLRAEIMGILGNFQIHPDDYRERGYTGYAEWAPMTSLAAGVSSRIAHVDLDPQYVVPMWRHAHGIFGRWSTPWKPLVVTSEIDYILDSPKDLPRNEGVQSMLQFDFEPWQGIHYQLLGELGNFGPHGSDAAYSGWASFMWFFAPHMDIRLDGIFQSLPSAAGRTSAQFLLAQFHLYL